MSRCNISFAHQLIVHTSAKKKQHCSLPEVSKTVLSVSALTDTLLLQEMNSSLSSAILFRHVHADCDQANDAGLTCRVWTLGDLSSETAYWLSEKADAVLPLSRISSAALANASFLASALQHRHALYNTLKDITLMTAQHGKEV